MQVEWLVQTEKTLTKVRVEPFQITLKYICSDSATKL
jgi:hypothetical protein